MTNEELEQKVRRLEEQLTEVRIELLERKADKKPYEVEVPDDINHLGYLDEDGYCIPLEDYDYKNKKNIYLRGLAFETREEAEKYDKERILLFKMHKWAEEHNGGWKPNWENGETKYYISYEMEQEFFNTEYCVCYRQFTKLPYFKSEEIVKQFIEEFRDEIKEVLCK